MKKETTLLRIDELDRAKSDAILKQRWPQRKHIDQELSSPVRQIVETVEKRGDSALIEYTMKFDKVKLRPDNLRVTKQEIEDAYKKIHNEELSAIKFAKDRIDRLEKKITAGIALEYNYEGIRFHTRTTPIESAGCYVPGGEATYPSTVLMTALPAKIAGVPRVVVCSPPRSEGGISPLTVVAADICAVNEIYKVGGAQAIAALAYGTETIRPVEKIVGPGNRYVLAAKALVSKDVPIDLPAGPSEILVLADETADPRTVALDMLSQAEHGADTVSILVTSSKMLAEAVADEFKKRSQSTTQGGSNSSTDILALICRDMDEAVAFVNEFAPEHLEVITKNASTISERITSAGLILIGEYTPVAASDYCLGTNHVLPTGGYGRVFSGLSAASFVRRVNVVECSREGLSKVRENVTTLARSEGLPNHGLAVEARFDGK